MGLFDSEETLLATTKTVLETVRNFAVVTALGYLGKSMNSDVITAIYYFTIFVFVMNVFLNIPFPTMLGRHIARKKFKQHAFYSIPLFMATLLGSTFLGSYIVDLAGRVIEFQDKQHVIRVTTIPACRFSLDLTGMNCVGGP